MFLHWILDHLRTAEEIVQEAVNPDSITTVDLGR